MESEAFQFQIEYSSAASAAGNEELRVYLVDGALQQARREQEKRLLVRVGLKLSDFVKLDNGSAYLGFTHETLNLHNIVSIENWTFVSEARSNQQDPWNGLSLDYRSHWPLHLMFSPDVIEKYNTLFRFLLPVKRVQLELQTMWASKVRSMKAHSSDPSFRKTMLLRQHMSFLIDNIFAYL